jgi:hypothetical protein
LLLRFQNKRFDPQQFSTAQIVPNSGAIFPFRGSLEAPEFRELAPYELK